MERDGLLDNAAAMGRHFTETLQRELAEQLASGAVKEIRGRGLMIGIELAIPCSALMQKALDKGLLISVTAESVVRLVPPLIVSAAEVDAMVAILAPLIRDFLAANGAPA
jgi:acetylornithine aminotransferase